MEYSVLAINPGHNGSVALVKNGELVFYIEEERLTRQKYDGNPFKGMLYVLQNYHVDELVIGGTYEVGTLPWTGENPYAAFARKIQKHIKVIMMHHMHHLGHAAGAFYNSGFDSAAAIIVDGAGSYREIKFQDSNQVSSGFETESIFKCNYPHEFEPVYQRYSDGTNKNFYFNDNLEFESSITITKAYEAVTDYLGFGFIEAGKTMGLAPYGKEDPNIPDFFINGKGNKNLFIPEYPRGAVINQFSNRYLMRPIGDSGWHNNPSRLREIDANIAFKIQKETEEQVIKLIELALERTNEKNIVIAGGYGLNCVANYKFIKHFPGVNIYVDPVSHDGGTAIGLAKLGWYHNSEDTTVRPLKSLYLGETPSYQNLQADKFNLEDVTPKDVAELIVDGNIVAIFQGSSEAGPRALGNRSILFDPRVPDGKDIVNSVKKREWFRPFAGSVLEEYANDWFDLAGMTSSPFMMYAVKVHEDKVKDIPAITHVDNTCRIQTVNPQDNENYYNLIKEFYNITGVPVLFNTSFNLAGDPLVETLEDAYDTLERSDIKYLYLADLGKLVTKRD